MLRTLRRKSYNNDIGNDQSAEQIRGCQICRVEFSNAAEKLCHDESVHHASKLPASAFYGSVALDES